MGFDLTHTLDVVMDETKEVAETAQSKTNEFHENYVSKILPDCGKYGDAATFAAEMIPGVSEYNAIREGDWTAFAIAAGLDVGAIAIGAFTAGAGYAAVKGGTTAAKTGVKVAAKEIVEAGAKTIVKETAEAGAEKAAKELVEAGAEKAAKEIAEAGVEKAAKEIAEAGAEKAAKEIAEAGAEKAAKEVAEAGAEKAAKEVAEAGAEKAAKEIVEEGAEKTVKEAVEDTAEKVLKETADEGTEAAAKEIDEIAQVVKNKLDGIKREEDVLEDLVSKYGKDNVMREQFIRDSAGNIIKDLETDTARRIDFVVTEGDKVIKSVEVTSETASKVAQSAKELRILERAKDLGGAFIRDSGTGKMFEFTEDLVTEIVRLQ